MNHHIPLKFTKMHGLGNDFVVIDAIHQPVQLSEPQIQQMADRHFGIGFDQLLLVEPPVREHADFKYRIFNADGSEVAQCGNGARCFARFVQDNGLTTKNEICVDTDSGQLILTLDSAGLVTVNMGVPKHHPDQIPLLAKQEQDLYELDIQNQKIQFVAVSMGNPHAVITVEDVASAPVAEWGKILESHPIFPQRCNIGFMQILNRHHIKLRVYERGAAETMACGSGACAAVVAGVQQGHLANPDIQVDLPGGSLLINWAGRGQPVFMKGPAIRVFEGQIIL